MPRISACRSRSFIPTFFAKLTLLALAAASSAQPSFAQRGALTAPADLSQLVQSSAVIVRGHVVSAVVEPHPQLSNLQTVVVTFSVSKVLKGDAPALFTFRQFVWDIEDVANAAGYQKSSELLLLLNPNSPYGLTSPVGLEQGRFRIYRDAKGNAYALNGRRNAGLFVQLDSKASAQGARLSPQARALATTTAGPATLGALEDAISALVGVQR